MHGSYPGHNHKRIVSDSGGCGMVARELGVVSWETLRMEGVPVRLVSLPISSPWRHSFHSSPVLVEGREGQA
jgi:hypothetical protein